MSVVVKLNDGSDYKLADTETERIAYTILPGGGVAVVVKPKDKALWVRKEFSPSGYQWVEGARWNGELSLQAGIDGSLEFSAKPGASLIA